jgi:AP-3 complex subunit delta-1
MSLKSQKKTGYMAAAISFHRDTPVLIMATNLIKKDLNSNDISETIMALHTMAHILNHDLARDLYPEVLSLFNNSNFNVRQRALLVIYRICIKYPACFNTVFDRIVEKLADEDERVVSACVTVICELGRVNPEVYLPLVPKLFGLFCNSTNNWILIKMIKLFTSLTPLEPRLGKKLLAPLKNIIKNNNSMSVVYEAVYAIIAGDMLLQDEDDNVAILCVQKLQLFIKQSDPNLKFLGLLCFGKLIKTRPEIVKENRIRILKCLDNGDISIRINALDLTTALVSPDTLFELVQKLMSNLADTNGILFFKKHLLV